MSNTIKNLLGEETPIEEVITEMSKAPKEEVIIIRGEEIPKRIYDLCVMRYLSIQYGEDLD